MNNLKLITGFLFLIFITAICANNVADFYAPENGIKNGDIIFQTSLSAQSKAIQLATKSKYSHCGLIFKEKNTYYVFEAIQPVKKRLSTNGLQEGNMESL